VRAATGAVGTGGARSAGREDATKKSKPPPSREDHGGHDPR